MSATLSSPSPRVSSVLLRELCSAAVSAGVDRQRLLTALDVEAALLDNPDATLDGQLLLQAWDLAARWSHDAAFGLHVGERAALGAYDVVDYAMISSRTVGDGLARGVKYYRILSDQVDVRVRTDGALTHLEHRPPESPHEGAFHAWECFFSGCVARFRIALGASWGPRSVEFSHRAPRDTLEHRRVFRAPVTFDQPINRLTIDTAILSHPVPSMDPRLERVVVRFADALVARAEPGALSLIDQARGAVRAALREGEPTVQSVASSIGTSARSLQRALQSAGTSFRMLVDEARFEAAQKFLADRRLTINEIAFRLGFAQPHAFHRAFRRWSGTTVMAFREGLGG